LKHCSLAAAIESTAAVLLHRPFLKQITLVDAGKPFLENSNTKMVELLSL
jgi:hypothetical protein